MTMGKSQDERQVVYLSVLERTVLGGFGTLLVAFLGFIFTLVYNTHNHVNLLVERVEQQTLVLKDHEVRLRVIEKAKP